LNGVIVMKRNGGGLIITVVVAMSSAVFILDDLVGTFLIYLSVALLLLFPEIRNDLKVLVASLFALLIHHFVSILNIYYATVYGAEVDAAGFHEKAQIIARSLQPNWLTEFGDFEPGTKLYTQALAFCYTVLGDSLLTGQGLSIIAYAISCGVLIKLANHLGIVRWRVHLVALYGLLPPAVFFGSVTLREPYQMLFFLLAIYWAMEFKSRPSFKGMMLLTGSSVLLGLLHNGLVIYAIFLVGFSSYWGLASVGRGWNWKKLILQVISLFIVAGIFAAWSTIASDLGGPSHAIVAGEGMNYAGKYRQGADTEARAAYNVDLNFSSPLSLVSALPLAFIYYLFAPFPWQVRNALDVYAAIESLLRLLLIYHALVAWWRATGMRRSQYGYLLVVFFSLEFLWALGTANWGTAIRHHLVAYGVLLVMGGPGLCQNLLAVLHRVIGRGRGFPLSSMAKPRLALSSSRARMPLSRAYTLPRGRKVVSQDGEATNEGLAS
jgi:hypothetical protein